MRYVITISALVGLWAIFSAGTTLGQGKSTQDTTRSSASSVTDSKGKGSTTAGPPWSSDKGKGTPGSSSSSDKDKGSAGPGKSGTSTTVSIGLRNEMKSPIIVQGTSIINNVARRGPPITVAPGKTVYDNNVPNGVRTYTVYDAAQPTRALLRDQSITVGSRDKTYIIKSLPGNSGQATMVESGP